MHATRCVSGLTDFSTSIRSCSLGFTSSLAGNSWAARGMCRNLDVSWDQHLNWFSLDPTSLFCGPWWWKVPWPFELAESLRKNSIILGLRFFSGNGGIWRYGPCSLQFELPSLGPSPHAFQWMSIQFNGKAGKIWTIRQWHWILVDAAGRLARNKKCTPFCRFQMDGCIAASRCSSWGKGSPHLGVHCSRSCLAKSFFYLFKLLNIPMKSPQEVEAGCPPLWSLWIFFDEWEFIDPYSTEKGTLMLFYLGGQWVSGQKLCDEIHSSKLSQVPCYN